MPKKPQPKGLTRSELESALADKTGLKKSEVKAVFEALYDLTAAEVKKGKPIVVPNLVKVYVQDRKATPARPGRNPMTGETITISAKPACKKVKAKPIGAIKTVL